jgi:hypothetical protein
LEKVEQEQDLMFLVIPASIRQEDRVSIQLLPTAESPLPQQGAVADHREIFPAKLSPEAQAQVPAHLVNLLAMEAMPHSLGLILA